MLNGQFHFQNRQRGKLVVERTGTIIEAVVEKLDGYLAASDFP